MDAAARELGALLEAGPDRLLVLDDVWFTEQLQPFLQGGQRCARLVTTRNRLLMLGRGLSIPVDQMSAHQARQVLQFGLPPMSGWVVAGLLEVTGRWPLLLRLINKILVEAHGAGRDLSGYGQQLLERLRCAGPSVVDEIAGVSPTVLAVDTPAQRARAVQATMQASIGLLTGDERRLLLQLSVFSADGVVPLSLVARLWRVTEGVDELRVPQVCARLDELALINLDPADGGRVSIHDVVRDYLRDLSRKDDAQALVRLNGLLLDEVAGTGGRWWELGDGETYLWDEVIGHLIAAGRDAEAEALATDIRWATARLMRFGSAAPMADLARVGTPRAERMRRALTRTAHLLGPTDPPESIADVLRSRLAEDPDWGPQISDDDPASRPRLVNRWHLPDLPDLALLHILIGHTAAVAAVAINLDGKWLATASLDRTVRLWDVAAGRQRAVFHGHTGPVLALAISPDGTWLASASRDGTIRTWDAATGGRRHAWRVQAPVTAIAVGPDGAQLATAGQDRTVRVWDAATGRQRAVLRGAGSWMHAVGTGPDGAWLAISSEDTGVHIDEPAPGGQHTILHGYGGWRRSAATASEGSWLAAAGEDSRVRVWEVTAGRQLAVVQGPAGRVSAVELSSAGNWLATGNHRGTVRIWHTATGLLRAILRGHHGSIVAAAASADGTWLATAAQDHTVRVWDVRAARQRAVHGPIGQVSALAISRAGDWLVTAGEDTKVRIWDVAATERSGRATQRRGHTSANNETVTALAADPGGRWLAAGGTDHKVRLWESVTGQLIATMEGHTAPITALAVSPDGSWLASAGEDGTTRVWDSETQRQTKMLQGHASAVSALAVAADGSWLASGGHDELVLAWQSGHDDKHTVLARRVRPPLAMTAAPGWLAAAGADGVTRLWHLSPQPNPSPPGRPIVLRSRSGPITAIAADPAGSWIATASESQIQLWDAATGAQGRSFPAGAGPVAAMSVSPNGKLLAIGAQDTLRVYRLDQTDPAAMMRIDAEITTCTWVGDTGLAAGAGASLYLFTYTDSCPTLGG